MKLKELIEALKEYDSKDIDVLFKLIPNDGTEEDSDEHDQDIDCVGEIYTGGLESEAPFVEIGFQIPKLDVFRKTKKAKEYY